MGRRGIGIVGTICGVAAALLVGAGPGAGVVGLGARVAATPAGALADADLALSIVDSPDPVGIGQQLTYDLMVDNLGPAAATSATLTNTLPAAATFVSATTSHGTCAHASGVVTCPLGDLAEFDFASIQIRVTAPNSPATLTNTASVTTTATDPNTANNSVSENTSVVAASADLAVSIFDSSDPAGLGQPLDYDVTVSNLGPTAATSVSLTDMLPSGATFVSATPSQGTCGSPSGGAVTCSLGNIAAQGFASVTVRVTTPTSPTTLTNAASVTSATPDPVSTNNSASEPTSVESGVDLAVTKRDSADPVHPGGGLTYTVRATNNGPNPATGVRVTDALPSGVTFISATPSQGSCSQASGTVTCNVGALAPNASASIDIVVTTPSSETTLTNTATVTGNEAAADPDTTNNSASEQTAVVVAGAVITNGTVTLGVNRTGDLNYDCRSAGDPTCPAASAGGVDPVGLRFNALNTDGTAPGCLCEGWGMADAVSGLTGYDNEAAGQANITVNSFVVDGTIRAVSDVTISDPSKPGHQMRVVQDYHPSAASSNMYENTVTVTNTGASTLGAVRYRRVMDWDVEPTAFSEWSTIQGTSPQLLFDSDNGFASANPLAGRSDIHADAKCGAGYTGPCAFKDLGSAGEYPAVTAPADIGALFDFQFGSLAAGQSKTFRVFYGAAGDEAAALSAISSVGAEVYSIGESSCPTGSTVGGCSTLPANAGVEQGKPNTFIFAFVTTAGDLSITKSDSPDPVRVGQDLTYTLAVRNNGPDPVTAVQVSDPLPAGVTHVSTATTRGTCSGTTTVTCNLGTMPNGASDTITIVVRPTAPGTLSNTATVSSPSEDVNLTNNTSTASTTVNPAADLSLTKTDAPDPVLAGSELTYTLTVTNNGPNDAAGVTIADPLPAGVSFVSAGAGCAYNSGTHTVTCTIGALANGANVVRTIVVRPTAANPSLSNTATASATTADPVTTNNSATATTVVNPAADLALTKTDAPDPVLAGNELTYTLTVTNNGPSDAADVTITDTLPAGVSFVSAGSGCVHAAGTVTCTIGALANGTTAVRTIVVRPSAPGPLSNTASVSSTTADPNAANNSATATTTVSPVPTLSITDVSQLEGNSGTTAFVFTVTKSATGHPASVDFATADGTAGSASDYTAGNGTLSFGAGDATKTITVLVNGDTTFEADETFFVNLSNATGATIADNQGQGTIQNDDSAPTLAIDNVSTVEGNAGTTAFTFTVTKTGATELPATVDFATADGTATAPVDYASGNGTLNFAAGDTSKQVTVLVNGDITVEPNETFFVNLLNPSGATIADNQGQGTIENDDGAAALSITDVSIAEGNTGTTAFTFTVTKSNTDEAASVDFATADGTATQPGDYAANSGTLTFASGEATKTFTVLVSGDTTFEANETFVVNLSNATGATIADNQGQGTIENDDAAPTLAIDDVSNAEGNSGTTAFTFTVTKTGATELPASVGFATADGTAAQPGDYAAQSGTLNFAAGETSKQFTVAVNGDTTFEADETFFINLSSPSGATISDNQGQGTIENDDAAPTLAIDDVTKNEGSSGTTAFTFTVTKTGSTELPASVDFATADGTATAPDDYAAASGTINFAAGDSSKQVTVLVNGDTTVEPNGTFFVNLSNAIGATIADNQGLGTIQDDDAATLSISDVTKAEGNTGTTEFAFTVTKSNTDAAATVDFATADGTAGSASDYGSLTGGTLNFASGEASKTITVLVNGDTTFEANETFLVNLSNAIGATIADNQGQGTIENDDSAPTLRIDNVMLAEGNAGTTAFVFTVTKTGATELPASVDFAAVNGTATSASDYMNASGSVNFGAADATKTITVLVNGDTTFEVDESFFVTLSNAGGATIDDNQAEAAIVNDDTAPTLAISDVSMAEGNAGTTAFTFAVTKAGPTELSASVAYETGNGTATAPDDYAAQSGMLIFAAGDTSKLVTVLVNGDTAFEPDETFVVNLSTTGGATIADNQGQGSIQNDDGAPTLAINDVIRAEGNTGTTGFTFTVTKSATDAAATVNFATADGTGTAPGDYAAQSGTLSFAAAETSKAVTVLVNGDTTVEPDETFFVNLASASGATIADNQGQATIQNDDTVTRPPVGTRPCVVPNVKGKTVSKARRLLAEKRCALGRVTYAYSRRVKKGRIISQSKRPGTRHPRGTKVNVVVSRGKPRASRRDND